MRARLAFLEIMLTDSGLPIPLGPGNAKRQNDRLGMQKHASQFAGAEPVADVTPVATIPRSIVWIVTGAIASLLFIFILGRGLTWSR